MPSTTILDDNALAHGKRLATHQSTGLQPASEGPGGERSILGRERPTRPSLPLKLRWRTQLFRVSSPAMQDWRKARTIGIVACSGPGAALCYETITAECGELLGSHHHPEIVLHSSSFGEYCRLLEEGDWPAIASLLANSCAKLETLGADFAICPDNTVHEAMDHASLEATLPWLHIAEVVAREAHTRGFRRLAILGTSYLMEGPVYPDKLAPLGIKAITPNTDDRSSINTLIFDRLVFNRVTSEDRSTLLDIIERLHDEHQCDAVVLGCTELPLILNDQVSPLPTLDSTRLLARAAIERAATRD